MKLTLKEIAELMIDEGRSTRDKNNRLRISEVLCESMDDEEFYNTPQISYSIMLDTIEEHMDKLTHPEPTSREEYNERYGIGEGE